MLLPINSRSFFTLLLGVLCLQTNAQIDPSQAREVSLLTKQIVLPTTPEAAAFSKYGEYSVNAYTGQVNIGIPIYTIKGKDVQFPINLSYDGSGNKVQSIPTWVGLGWNLQVGGTVSRVIQAMPDEKDNYYDKHLELDTLAGGLTTDSIQVYNLYERVADGEIESQPDNYYYSFPGHSGKFYFKPKALASPVDSNIVFKHSKDIRFSVDFETDGDIEDFEFTDENGTTYFFTTVEYTDYTLDDDSDFIWHKTNYQYNSVWYLDSIVSANNEEVIVLDYSTISTAYEPPTNPEYYKSLTYNTSGSTLPGGCSSYSLCGSTSSGVLSFASAHVQKVYNRRFLEKVTYRRDGQKIEEIFLHASNYNHLSDSKYNGKRLDSIVVVKGADNPLRVRAFDFTYKSDTELNRLALDNIQEASYDDSQIKHVKPPYEFSYNSTSLPAPTSSSVDHWGYYNTNSHTGSLIPSVTLGCGGSAVTYPGGNANRDPNESRMKAGILERITYPTGGYTDFVFEAHRVEGDPTSCSNPIPDRIGGGLRIKEIKNYSSTGNLANKKTYNYKKEGSSYSSGIYMVEPIYYRNSTYYHDQVGTVGGGTCADKEYTCRKITLSSSSRTPLGAVQGSYVGYDRVEEQIYGMGKVVYHYSNKPLSAGFYEIMDNGQLTKKEVYDEDDNQLTETTYTYSTYASDQRRTNSFGPVRVEPSSFQSNQTILCYSSGYYNWKEITDPGSCTESATFESRYEAKPYLIRQRWFKVIKDSTVQKFYSSGGSLLGNVSVLQEFTYGNEAVTLPTKTETTNSDGESYELLVTFPGPSDERGMFLNNKVTAPITKEWKVGGNTIYKNRIDYSSLVPEYYYEKFGSTSELLRETFDLYDEHDNVLEAHKEHDEPISFIWDHYGGTLAAQVKNASQSEIAFTSFESKSTTQGNWYGIDDSKINLDPDFNSDARTGFGYLTGTSSLSTTLVAGDYHLSYYTKNNSNVSVTPSPGNTTVHAVDDQGWYYVEHTFSFSGSRTLQVSVSNTRIDELRVHPVDAEMVTFSHDQRTHLLISMADEHSVHQRFSYDSLLRLETVRDYNLDHIEAYAYEYDVSGSSPLNRIKSWMVEKVGVKNFDNGAGDKVVNLTGEDVIRMYSYVDGLGRPVQTIGVGQSPSSTISNNKDIVSHIAYDAYGRQNKQFLPYTIANSTPGAFRSSAATEQSSFYSGIDGGYGYTEYEFDDSPLNRIFVEKPEGSVYRSHPREVEYYANSANEVRDFESGGYYPANTLFETRVLDENNRYTTTYVDKLGRKVMENNGGARTYFIYDDFGALKAVITPEGAKLGHSNSTWLYTHSSITPKSYEYTYDATLHRLIEKKVPGSDAYEYYYDRLDRPVLTVDGNGFKTFAKFDALGRPIMTGRYTGSSNTISGSLPLFESKTSSGPHYYTNSAFPTSNFDVYTVTYYDNYDVDENGSLSSAESYRIPPTGYDSPVYRSRGLPTVEKTAVLNNNGTAPSTYLFTRMFYDLKKRMVQTYSQNQLSGSDRIYEAYSFSGRLEKSKREHSATLGGSGKSTTIEKSYSYDHSGRLLEIAQATDGGAFQTIVQHEYDERTNLSTKKLHNTTGSSYLYELDYTYNIRGWLEQINTFDDPGMIFAMQLHYGEGDEDLSSAYEDGDDANYNGNITMLEWQVGEDGDRATYGLLYDPLNRLDGAVYGFYEPPYGYNRNYRYELSVDYDQNGNITDFWRRGETGSPGSELFSVIDNMDYTYDSEGKLSSVYENSSTTYGFNGSGATANYTYDNNGNLISDANRGISSVDYNHLNLPTKVTYSGGQWIEWTYDALGTKLQKSTSTGDDRYYEGDIEYQNTSLAVIYHEEGFLQPDGSSGFDYFYYLRDHLGNTRLIVQDANSNGSLDTTEIVQENHYYPFGMQMQGDWMGSSVDNYTYNGKEWNDDFGLDWLDYGARWYDPSIGRWNAVDPLASEMPSWSPYSYTFNNPIRFIDPDGRAPDDFVQRSDGSIYWDNNANSQATTQAGETYLGKDLTFTFNSYIDANLWDGPGGNAPAGDKLTTTVSLSASENAAGELTGISATKQVEIGSTPVGTARDYFPGLGDSQNSASATSSTNADGTLNSYSLNLEQHASVSPIEQFGLNLMGYDIVNVAQRLQLDYSGGNLSVTAGTDVFPSATLSVNGNQLFKYNQPSFKETHGRNKSFSDNGRGSVDLITTPRRPAPSFHTRYKN